MYNKLIWLAIIALMPADGKKSRSNDSDSVESTPQPNILLYSTFGFNDVGPHDGFVQSSPDYATYPNRQQDSRVRLYAPAFPSAIEATGSDGYYDPDQTPLGADNEDQTNVNIFQPVPINFFTPNHESFNEKKNTETENTFDTRDDSSNHPIYGTKINSKSRNKPAKDLNTTEYNILDSVSTVIENNNDDYNTNLESRHQSKSMKNQYNVNYPSINSPGSFPKVIDFTDAKKYYPSSVESKYTNLKPIYVNAFQTDEFNNKDEVHNDQGSTNQVSSYNINGKDSDDFTDKETSPVSFSNQDHLPSYSNVKNNLKNNKYKLDYKQKLKTKYSNNNNDEFNKLRDLKKGYEYSTNYSTASFHYDYDKPKRQFNSSIDEVSPESSNINIVGHRYPNKEFSSLRTLPFSLPDPDIYKPSEEYLNAFKNYYSDVPSTASQWSSFYKPIELSSHKKQPKKTYLFDDDNEEIVHIPKRPHSSKYGMYSDSAINEWPYANEYTSHSPSVTKQPEWAKDYIRNKFKTEEDLLGLRNHDDFSPSHPSSFKYNDLTKEFDFENLSERWRQNFLKSKAKEPNRDYESYASDTKPIHISRPKPYAIEIPHPVIVPVPQPYPVRVPIPKPVAVPVIQELTVPVEKPMPYPVIKKVPYIVERPVPVPVEKQVRVPVVKPYPVHVPQVRPVFHHSQYEDDDEYEARPDTRRPVYKRHKNTHGRARPTTRRPTRTAYRDNQRRRPVRKPGIQGGRKHLRRPTNYQTEHSRYEDFEHSDSEFERYCQRTGKC
ncbi:putative uncharacterized protein DDB_G0282133 [Danaus plexippus]|uniref:putative uncharacterized protein DDB_G0282133 n=1 Tax=Danaus plexippus TaxID=13037 RepID=UPI002AB2404B|nr:putative uncharacterized protein DDB_G0282133 [Danaus plexippus]